MLAGLMAAGATLGGGCFVFGQKYAERRAARNSAQVFARLEAERAALNTKTDGNHKSSKVEGAEEVATLTLPDGSSHELKILRPDVGTDVFLDIRDLQARAGYFTFDPGFTCTGSCMSAITFIDGAKGVCLYRGYPVSDLCEHASALEVAYLLLVGELPSPEEYSTFTMEVKRHMLVHESVKAMFKNFPYNAHPMAILVSVVGGLACVFGDLDPFCPDHRWLAATRLIGKMPVLAAMSYKSHIGEPMIYPKTNLGFAENFLYMMFATPLEEYKVNPVHANAINAFMILHMDHEQNASTSTVRIAASSQANPYACIAAGIASLWGPAHGGANEAVIKMLQQIGRKDNVEAFIADVKAKKEGVRLMGFGHRVYKNYDPRAQVMKKLCASVLAELGVVDPLLEVAQELERVALADSYFVKRKLYPNVDYYSGIMLTALGIPTSMFTAMFAMARTVGWVTQWMECVSEDQMRIGRPRQWYVGSQLRVYPGSLTTKVEETKTAPIRSLDSKQSFSKQQAEIERKCSSTDLGGLQGKRSFSVKLGKVDTR